MPVSGYHNVTNPETGEVQLVPDLSSQVIEYTIEDMKKWVADGYISPELQEIYTQETLPLKKNDVASNTLINLAKDLKPWALTEYLLKNKALLFGVDFFKKIYSRLHDNDPDIVWLKFIKDAVEHLAARDPLPIHFHTARCVLKDKFNIEEPRAVDILARSLLEHCLRMKKYKSFHHDLFSKRPLDTSDLDEHFEDASKNTLQLDSNYIEHLRSIGVSGKKLATKVEANSKAIFEQYKKENYPSEARRNVWGLWVPNGQIEPLCYFLYLMGQVLWEDECGRYWNRQTSQVPAVVKPVIEIIKPMLSSTNKKKIITQENQIVCCNQDGSPIFYAPTIDPSMISMLQNGVQSLSTLTGHKLLRWQIKTGFENWATNKEDPRIITIDGGFSVVADLVGCNSTKEISKIKDIMQAQAFGQFIFPDGSRGNMIILRILERYRNSEPSKISITLGDMLLPNYVFQVGKNERRLIPIGDLPPLHGSKNSHAHQAQLQLLVFEEFSKQSDRMAEEGSAIIPMDKWKVMASEAGLNPNKVDHVIQHWCQPDLINCFLDKQGDEYCLASYYENAQKFLVSQGQQRLINSERGRASARKKIEAKS